MANYFLFGKEYAFIDLGFSLISASLHSFPELFM